MLLSTRTTSLSDKVQRILSCLFSTFIRAYPFLALIRRLAVLDAEVLQPCNEGCTFTRYWSSAGLPRTTIRGAPVFITITNGVAEPDLMHPGWYESSQRHYSKLFLQFSELFTESLSTQDEFKDLVPDDDGGLVTSDEAKEDNKDYKAWKKYHSEYVSSLCPALEPEEMKKTCNAEGMKERVATEGNHLATGRSLDIYLWSVSIWAITRGCHDSLVISLELEGELLTLFISMLGSAAQTTAVASGFFWAIGAAEVFMIRVPGHDACACYFEMSTVAMFALIGTPAAFYVMTRNNLWKLLYAALHGDYLHNVHFSVPYRVTKKFNKDPTYDFLIHESGGGGSSVPRVFWCKQYEIFNKCFGLLHSLWNIATLYVVYAFAFPALTVRFYDVVVVGFQQDGLTVFDLAAYLFFAFCIGAPLYTVYIQLKRLPNCLTRAKVVITFLKQGNRWNVPRMFIACFNTSVQICQIGGMIWLAVMSLKLPAYLWQAQEVTAESAGELGAAGFYMLVAFLNAYEPSGISLWTLREAISVKSGTFLPIGGLKELYQLAEDPNLGLEDAKNVGKKFQGENMSTRMDEYGAIHSSEVFDIWCDFAVEELDKRTQEGIEREKREQEMECNPAYEPLPKDD